MFPYNRERALYRLGRKRQPHTEWPDTAPLKITKLIPSDFVDEDNEEENVVQRLGLQVQGNLGMVMEVCMSGMVAKPDAKAIDANQEARDAATAALQLAMDSCTQFGRCRQCNRTKTLKRRRSRQRSKPSARQPGEKYINREAQCEDNSGSLDSGSSSGSSDSSSASGSSCQILGFSQTTTTGLSSRTLSQSLTRRMWAVRCQSRCEDDVRGGLQLEPEFKPDPTCLLQMAIQTKYWHSLSGDARIRLCFS
eukprot:577170-Rhodomonas_salina.1